MKTGNLVLIAVFAVLTTMAAKADTSLDAGGLNQLYK
jgi:hypothetical protein